MLIASPDQFCSLILNEGLWHTTSSDRLEAIVASGAIKVEPAISDNERHKTANGPANYPFARSIGAVSIFDFSNFDPAGYGVRFPVSNWRAFVPCYHKWSRAIWIEIDATECGSKIISGAALLNRWRMEEAYAHTLMPHIEGAHVGDIPITAIKNVLVASPTDNAAWEVELVDLKASQSAPAPQQTSPPQAQYPPLEKSGHPRLC